jgi:RimJ/RimL family protein N-acetyltransferase
MIFSGHIRTNRLILRSLDESDATERYAAWLNDRVVNQYLETRSVTLEDLRRYIKEKRESPKALFLGIFANDAGLHIGNVKLEPIAADKATMGILIGDMNYWGKGIATEVTNAMCAYAFDRLGLSEVNLGVIAENNAAIRVYEKCGFTVDHAEKNAINHEGKLFDQVCMVKKKIESRK